MSINGIIGLFFLLLNFINQKGFSQNNLSVELSASINNKSEFFYIDSTGKFYRSWGDYAGWGLIVIFKNVEFNKENNKVIVEGRAAGDLNDKDTVGLCCVIECFIAQPVNDSLKNIRKLIPPNSNQTEDNTKPDGYFRFEIMINEKDKLYFVNTEGGRLTEFNIGKVCFENAILNKKQ